MGSIPERVALVTGASGFVGGAVARKLVECGTRVRVLVRPESPQTNLRDLPVEVAGGDLRDPSSLRAALRGCAVLYHVAALYRLWVPDRRLLLETNVVGTRRLLEAAGEAGVDRIVYTSTVGAIPPRADGQPADEKTPARLEEISGAYKQSKFLAEQEVGRLAAQGLPVVIVNPSTPVGPGDVKPTPTGQMVVDYLGGKMWAYLDTGLNLVDVDDVAAGHLLAAERGRLGERYILGNRNLHLREIFQILEGISGIPAPRLKAPRPLVYGVALAGETLARVTGRPPRVPLDAVRMAKRFMYFDSGKAVRELGLPQSPVEQALERAARWFVAHRYAPAPPRFREGRV